MDAASGGPGPGTPARTLTEYWSQRVMMIPI